MREMKREKRKGRRMKNRWEKNIDVGLERITALDVFKFNSVVD